MLVTSICPTGKTYSNPSVVFRFACHRLKIAFRSST
jgi:hypothetical protein